MEVETAYRRSLGGWTARVARVAAGAWRDPTPCDAWDVRALVAHVVGEDLWTAPLVRGATIEEVGDRFDGDLLGDDPVGTARSAAVEALDAVEDALPAARPVGLSYGEERLEEYLAQLAADHLVHTWDLAVATGGDADLDGELVAWVAAWYADREELYRAAGLVAERVAVSGGPQVELLAGFGRDPIWRVPG